MRINSKKTVRKQPASTPRFRGVLHAVDNLLPNLDPDTPEYAVLSFLRKHAIGPANAKSWKEILPHLRKCGHGSYRKSDFQRVCVRFCRRHRSFIASFHKGFYLPDQPKDYDPYLASTTKRIRGQQANLQRAMTLKKLQEEWNATRKAPKTRTRTTARRSGANRPTAARMPRKARSKSRRPTRS